MDIGQPVSVRGVRGRRSRRRLANDTALSSRFEFETLEPRVLMSADLLPVHGSIDVPGQINTYQFNLATAEQVYFDSQTPHSQSINWTLTGPRGTEVTNRSFENADAANLPGTAALSLVPGDYVLSVAGQGTATGAYDFHLLDLANAAPVAVGHTVTGQLTLGDNTDLYKFTANAGDSVFFDSHALDPQSTTWRVIGPENTLVFGQNGIGTDPAATILPRTGTYTVMIEGNVDQTTPADYAFTVFPVTTGTAPLTLNQPMLGSLATPGHTDAFSFTLAQPAKVLFDALNNRGDIQWTLTGATGDLVSNRTFNGADANGIIGDDGVGLGAGSYTLSVSGVGSATGVYGFQLLNLASAAATSLSDIHTGTLNDGGLAQAALHTVPGAPLVGSAVDRGLTLNDASVVATVPNSALLTPASVTVEAWVRLDYAAVGRQDIVRQGNEGAGYGLLIGFDGKLQFQAGGGVVETAAPLLGAWTHVAGTYDGATLRLYVNGVDVADQAYATPIAYDTAGLTIGARDAGASYQLAFGSVDEVRVWNTARAASDIAANYTLELGTQAGLVAVYHFGEATGLTLADSSGNGLVATLGPVPGTATQLLGFAVTAGQSYTLSGTTTGGDVTTRLFNAAGALLGTQTLYAGITFKAEVTGTYVAAVEGNGRNQGPASYSLQLVNSTPATATLIVGAQVDGSVALPGQSTIYSFTLASPTGLLFDTLAAGPGLLWTLTGPRGVEVSSRDLQVSDSANYPNSPLLALIAGAYTLTVVGNANTTGAYSFRLLDIATATPFKLGDTISVSLNKPAAITLESFTATAGDTVSFNFNSGAGTANWRLLDPYGRQVFEDYRTQNETGVALAATGTYTLVIDGLLGATTAASLQFVSSLDSHIDPVTLTGTPLAIGTVVNGSFTGPNQSADYTFVTTGPRRLYFDSLTDNGALAWSITGPRGVEITPQRFDYSDGNYLNYRPAEIDLPVAGTYQVHVASAYYFSAGSYAFNLLDVAAPLATLPTDGTVTNGTLDPANSTQVYAFAGIAGTTLILTTTPTNGYVEVRVLDPTGHQVLATGNGGTIALPIGQTGQYSILVEGDSYATGKAAFSVALASAVTFADPTPVPLALNADASGIVALPGATNRYTFTLAAATTIVVSSFTGDSTVQLALVGANGTIFSHYALQAQAYGAGSPFFALAAGSYTIAVTAPNATAPASFAFRLLDIATAAPLTAGTAVNATLEHVTAIDPYTITAQAGTQLRIVTSTSHYGGEQLLVLDPAGRPLAPPTQANGSTNYAIKVTGTYTVLYEGQSTYYDIYYSGVLPTVAYTITAYVDPAPTALAIGTRQTAALGGPNAIARYGFSLAAPTSLLFDSLVNNGQLNWTLTGPDGYSLSRNFTGSDSYDVGGLSTLALATGAYVLTITTGAAATYDFRLLNLASATPLALGTPVSATLTPGDATAIYSFAATKGQLLSLVTTTTGSQSVRLLDPYGQLVFGPNNPGQRLVTAAATGTYTILLEGRIYDAAATETYTVGIAAVPQPTVALTGLDSAKGSYSVPGQVGTALAFTGLEHIAIADQPAVDLGRTFTL